MSAAASSASGTVRDRIAGAPRPGVACQGGRCRRTRGHHLVAPGCDALAPDGAGTPRSWSTTPGHRRGFCGLFGGTLFQGRAGNRCVSVLAGSLDKSTEVAMAGRNHAAGTGDGDAIRDELPAAEQADGALTDGRRPA